MTIKQSDLTVGQTFEQVLVEDLKRTQIVQYAGASGDYNPLHSDELFTTKVAGYPSVFAHGMLTMGMTGRLVTGAARYGKFLDVQFDGVHLVVHLSRAGWLRWHDQASTTPPKPTAPSTCSWAPKSPLAAASSPPMRATSAIWTCNRHLFVIPQK